MARKTIVQLGKTIAQLGLVGMVSSGLGFGAAKMYLHSLGKQSVSSSRSPRVPFMCKERLMLDDSISPKKEPRREPRENYDYYDFEDESLRRYNKYHNLV